MATLVTDGVLKTPLHRDVAPSDRCGGSGRIERLLEAAETGALETSLGGLVALGPFRDLAAALRAVVGLDTTDHVVSVDPTRAAPNTTFEIRWAPVTGIVNLMLDWDLPILDITVVELAAWLEVYPVVAQRAVTWLAKCSGVEVTIGVEHVRIALDTERCPLTCSAPSSAA